MKEYFKLTGKKILGVIILLFFFSFISFFLQYISNPGNYVINQEQNAIMIGLPLFFMSIGGKEGTGNFNIFNLVIDIIIFYFVIVLFSIVFKGGKKQNVPNSNSGGGNTSSPNQTQP